jgi:hypothetical protein
MSAAKGNKISKILLAVIVVSVTIASIWGHAIWKSRQEFYLGLDAREQGKLDEAALYFQRAILWYTPGSSFVYQAAKALWQISIEAEGAGQTEKALSGYRALRSAFYACRSLYVPGKEWIERCDQKIARLMAEQETPILSEKGKTKEERRRDYLALLQAPMRPREPWAAAAALGFAGWVVASVGFILQGLNPAGGFQGRRAAAWGGLFFLCYAIWLVGMWMA